MLGPSAAPKHKQRPAYASECVSAHGLPCSVAHVCVVGRAENVASSMSSAAAQSYSFSYSELCNPIPLEPESRAERLTGVVDGMRKDCL